MSGFLFGRKAILPALRNVRLSSGKTLEDQNKTAVLMKFIGTKICPVLIALSAYNAYKLEMEHRSHPRPEYVPYAHLLVHRTELPWGDGNHSLFHNPKTNYVPGIGYEEEWYTADH